MTQHALNLVGGFHVGPLFIVVIERAPKPAMRSTYRDRQVRRHTPKWADRAAIRAVFKAARYLTAKTGEQHSADHIVPLHHPLVCGLHVAHNLRAIPLVENMKKANRAWPDMPNEQMVLL